MSVSSDKPVEQASDTANWQSYLFGSLGSFPANVGICAMQAMIEMMIDTARMAVQIVKVPMRAQEGKTELAIRSVVEASMESVWNLGRNLFRPFKRSHLIGIEARHMMDVGMAFHLSLQQIRKRWMLFRVELWSVKDANAR